MTMQVDFVLTISSANSAFQESPEHALAETLRYIATNLENGHTIERVRIRDVNGNTVGECTLLIRELDP